MQVIICGAGRVGANIARYLAKAGNDVTVIDVSADLVRRITETVDVRGLVGAGSHPEVQKQAGASDADMIIAVTYSDEVNMVACQVAHSLFNVPTKIARVRQQSYLDSAWSNLFSRDHMPIDHIISPEVEVAQAIERQLQVPGAFDMIPLADGKVRVVGVHCGEDCPVLNTPLRQLAGLFPDLHITVIAIIRHDKPTIPSGGDVMLAGDDVYFVCDTDHLTRAMAVFGHEEPEARRIIIGGGGNIGFGLAHRLEERRKDFTIRVIESNPDRARLCAQGLDDAIVLEGDVLDPEILAEANISEAESFVAVSNEDEVNILSSLLAKRYGCQRALTLINKASYGSLVTTLGIDAVVSPHAITVSTVLQHVRRGRIRAVHSLRDGFGEIIEAEALQTSSLVGRPLRDARLPARVLLGAILRGDTVLIPRADTLVQAGDRVVVFAASDAVAKVEKLFSVSLEFF